MILKINVILYLKKLNLLSDSITKLDLQVLDIESNSEAAVEVGPLKYVSELLDKPNGFCS